MLNWTASIGSRSTFSIQHSPFGMLDSAFSIRASPSRPAATSFLLSIQLVHGVLARHAAAAPLCAPPQAPRLHPSSLHASSFRSAPPTHADSAPRDGALHRPQLSLHSSAIASSRNLPPAH